MPIKYSSRKFLIYKTKIRGSKLEQPIVRFCSKHFFRKGVRPVAWGKKRLIDYAACGG